MAAPAGISPSGGAPSPSGETSAAFFVVRRRVVVAVDRVLVALFGFSATPSVTASATAASTGLTPSPAAPVPP
ncbi:hypothetical protein AB0I81_37280 [Nonomuraea sp. NPDC050404]|uniref:hypothetical protein n=1 Tax=Nonomuraea sp. NPDC050404 TaxID=3155783 RepID=UPI0033D93424